MSMTSRAQAQVEVILDLEVKGALLPPPWRDTTESSSPPSGTSARGMLGISSRHRLELALDVGQLGLALLDGVAQAAHLGDRRGGISAGLSDDGDLVAGALARRAHVLDVGQQPAAALLESEKLIQRRRGRWRPAAVAPRRTWSGLERTIFTSSIVTPLVV